MDDLIKRAKEDFLKAAARAALSGIQTGTGGNISTRVPERNCMVVKPSGLSFSESTADKLIVADFDCKIIAGNLKPTREMVLHSSLYKLLPEVGGIVHTHSVYSTAWSLSGQSLPLVTKHADAKMKYPIPVVDTVAMDVRPEDMPSISKLFAEHPDMCGFILKGHGLVAVAKTAVQAEHMAELIEETAQIAWLHAVGRNIGLIAGK